MARFRRWPVVIVSAGLIAAGALWATLRLPNTTDRIALGNLLVVVATGTAVAWYSWETRLLRLATHRQTTLQIRPFLSLRLEDAGDFRVDNIGKGVARNVLVRDVRLSTPDVVENYIVAKWEPIDFIPDRDGRVLSGSVHQVSRGQVTDVSPEKRKTWMAQFGRYGSREFEFIIDYFDLIGQSYQAAYRISRGRITLIRDGAPA